MWHPGKVGWACALAFAIVVARAPALVAGDAHGSYPERVVELRGKLVGEVVSQEKTFYRVLMNPCGEDPYDPILLPVDLVTAVEKKGIRSCEKASYEETLFSVPQEGIIGEAPYYGFDRNVALLHLEPLNE